MPPKGDPLTAEQIALLEKWIEEGANLPGQMDAVAKATSDLWSLKPVVRPAVPKQAGAATAIDAFLLEKLSAKNLAYNPPADPRALIRRVSVLLTGLDPTPERVEKFLTDSKADGNAAYTGRDHNPDAFTCFLAGEHEPEIEQTARAPRSVEDKPCSSGRCMLEYGVPAGGVESGLLVSAWFSSAWDDVPGYLYVAMRAPSFDAWRVGRLRSLARRKVGQTVAT